ncbi:hypothetical protein QJU96_01650, partial [Pasteurella skyensis]
MTGNKVTVDNSPPTGLGAVLGAFHNAKEVSNNTVTINGGTVGDIRGGISITGTAKDNTITINGGTINGKIIGG